ncbi:MAG: nucleoid-associated protein [Campylobacterota bacterium]|nr:nucleoid-associated protein [Campylobacterota bacterium]
MIDFSQSKIKHLIIHEIGNKLRDEKVFLSETLQKIDEDLEDILLNYFFKFFLVEKELFSLNHNSNLNLNEIYTYSKTIFDKDDKNSFIKISNDIAKHLYEYSLHPKISKGELIIVEIENIIYEDNNINLIGIFKSEKKDSFLKIIKDDITINVKDDKGINISKLEKGCLVLNSNEENGYIVLNIDNKNQETDYWTNKFLNIKPLNNDIHKTKEIVKMCKSFSDEILSTKYNTDIKFTFNNDYINYFEDSESYDINSFSDSIFKNDDLKKDFFEYQESNKESFNFNINDRFELSQNDIKKEKKKVKNIIKLDTKLELKVLLNKDDISKNIEKGFDEEKGMSFYKIYFNEEIK